MFNTIENIKEIYNSVLESAVSLYGVIYFFRNVINDKMYIGQSIDFLNRMDGHKSSFKGKKKYKHLYNSIRKYGWENFEIGILDTCNTNQEELDVLECFYMEKFNVLDAECGYNKKEGGAKGHHIQETKDLISITFSGENHPWFGKHHTKESRELISKTRTGNGLSKGEKNPFFGKKHTNETKELISVANTGRIVTEERKRKLSVLMSGETNPMFGKTHTPEARKKIKDAKTGLRQAESTIKKRVEKVIISIDEIKLRLFQQHKDTVTIDESTYVKSSQKALFMDKVYGEWWALPNNVAGAGTKHPKRALKERPSRRKNNG